MLGVCPRGSQLEGVGGDCGQRTCGTSRSSRTGRLAVPIRRIRSGEPTGPPHRANHGRADRQREAHQTWRTGTATHRGCGGRGAPRNASFIDCMRRWSVVTVSTRKFFQPNCRSCCLRGMRGEIDAHFLLEARLVRIGAAYRHRAAIDLDHEIPSRAVGKLKAEDKIGNHADLAHLAAMRQLRSQRERGTAGAHRLPRGCDHFLGGDEPDIAALRHRALQRDLKIDDLDLVLDERPAGFAVLAAPLSASRSRGRRARRAERAPRSASA